MSHRHNDTSDLDLDCPECIARLMSYREAPEVPAVPMRRCTYRCVYHHNVDGWIQGHTFTLDLRIPPEWTSWDVSSRTQWREAFALSLPEGMSDSDVVEACETARVVRVTVGEAVAPPPSTPEAPAEQREMFR